MKEEDIRLGDLHRMFVGNAPWEFLLEIFIRSVFMYLLFYLLVRWLGKRLNGQLTLTEVVVMLTLGGVIAVPMQTPDRGLLQGMIVIACVFVFQRGLSLWGFYHQRIEKITQGRAKLLAKEGVLVLKEMEATRVSHYQLFSKLRAKNIYHLGMIKRVYLEAEGLFSIFENEEEVPGLSTLPEEDRKIRDSQQKAEGKMACCNCGHVIDWKASKAQTIASPCEVCHIQHWGPAVISKN